MQAKPPRTHAAYWGPPGRSWAALSPWLVAACTVVLVAVPLAIHVHKYPDFSSFWTGIDQHRYLESAVAWSRLDLSPDRHHYLPLYPLLGAAFVWLTPWQPFAVPDALCLVASLLLFIRIGRRLAPGWPDGAIAACFVLATLGGRVLVAVWVVPWSTTGSAPWQFAALLLALRFGERPSPGRALALGAALAVIAGFRPSDCAVLALCCGAYVVLTLAWAGASAPAWLRVAVASAAGAAIGLAPAALAHLAIFGPHQGAYLHKVAGIGLEWRLLPLRWTMLVADPRPLLPEGRGMAEILPWVLPGMAGLLLGVMPRTGHRVGPVALVGAGVVLHWAVYLAYRDMQPYGLWRYYNVHYFKWTFPFLVLWAAQLAAVLARRGLRRRATLALGAAALCLCWRPSPAGKTAFPIDQTGGTLALPAAFDAVDQVVWLPLRGDWTALYFGHFTMRTRAGDFANTPDFKVLPVRGGALLMLLRPVAGPATLDLPGDVQVSPGQPGWIARVRLSFGLPCSLRPSCFRAAG